MSKSILLAAVLLGASPSFADPLVSSRDLQVLVVGDPRIAAPTVKHLRDVAKQYGLPDLRVDDVRPERNPAGPVVGLAGADLPAVCVVQNEPGSHRPVRCLFRIVQADHQPLGSLDQVARVWAAEAGVQLPPPPGADQAIDQRPDVSRDVMTNEGMRLVAAATEAQARILFDRIKDRPILPGGADSPTRTALFNLVGAAQRLNEAFMRGVAAPFDPLVQTLQMRDALLASHPQQVLGPDVHQDLRLLFHDLRQVEQVYRQLQAGPH